MTIRPLLEHGFSLIPVQSRGKIPAGPWAHAQTERADMTDVYTWLEQGLNIGVATGQLSGVVVVDCDNAAAVARVTELGHAPTPTVLTGRGCHLYFAHPQGQPVRNAVALEDGIDLRGDGGFCVVPPSIHANGEEYRWATGLSLEDVPPAPLPAWALRASQAPQNGREPGEWGKAFRAPVVNGSRNQACAELAGYLLRKYVDRDVATELLLLWNAERCSPPMSAGEVRRTVGSIAAREEKRRGR